MFEYMRRAMTLPRRRKDGAAPADSPVGDNPPHLWRVNLCVEEGDAVEEFLQIQGRLTIGELIRNPYDLGQSISCIVLAIERDQQRMMLPDDDETLRSCDEILLCGTEHGETMLSATMNNIYTLEYLVTGKEPPRGYLFRWLASLSNAPAVAR